MHLDMTLYIVLLVIISNPYPYTPCDTLFVFESLLLGAGSQQPYFTLLSLNLIFPREYSTSHFSPRYCVVTAQITHIAGWNFILEETMQQGPDKSLRSVLGYHHKSEFTLRKSRS